MHFDRRRFLLSAAATGAASLSRAGWAAKDPSPATFTIYGNKPLAPVPQDFIGLSYESSQLAHPGFFSAGNKDLIAYVRTLGASGVLRVGGNMSAFTRWSPIDAANTVDSQGVEGPDAGGGTPVSFVITPLAINNLNEFLQATNWKLIYGLNLAGGTPETAAQEAACVAKVVGSRLVAFQLGNEPDLFNHGTSKDAKQRWQYPEYIARWKIFERAVRSKVPNAPLAGPDVSYRTDWIEKFSQDTAGDVSLLTSHYYAEGPPTDPIMNIDYLLTQQSRFQSHISNSVEVSRKAGTPYRVAECNSCYRGGKKGMSDTFASALWAGDFLCQVASLGATGVNLHGGADGLYTPIAGSQATGFTARPMYYGMLLARPLLGATILNSDLQPAGVNLTAYAAQKDSKLMAFVFNKDHQSAVLRICLPSDRTNGAAEVIRLSAPAIDATSQIKLGGDSVASNGSWEPAASEVVRGRAGSFQLSVPAYSAAAVKFI